jgi:hypothetical protein
LYATAHRLASDFRWTCDPRSRGLPFVGSARGPAGHRGDDTAAARREGESSEAGRACRDKWVFRHLGPSPDNLSGLGKEPTAADPGVVASGGQGAASGRLANCSSDRSNLRIADNLCFPLLLKLVPMRARIQHIRNFTITKGFFP